MRTLTYVVSQERGGATIESLLKNELQCSRSMIGRLKRRKSGVMLNGEKRYVTARVQAGDTLVIEIGDEPVGTVTPIDGALKIVYEDEDALVLDKPAGISMHASTRTPEECTLENLVAGYLGFGALMHPVSRLDRGTTGLVLFAKSGYAHERFKRMQHTSAYVRAYLAIAIGRVDPPEGTIDAPIGFYEGSSYRRAVDKDGQSAVTRYRTLQGNDRITLLDVLPETGRMHQIRVHFSYLGYPLAGDWLYGTEDADLIARPALHSARLDFVQPLTGQRITLNSPLPEDMARLLI